MPAFCSTGEPNMICRAALFALLPLTALVGRGQQAPPSPDKAWPVSIQSGSQAESIQPSKGKTHLSIPIASIRCPIWSTLRNKAILKRRILWERAKQRAAAVGIARSALFPTVAAVASASVNQYSLFFGKFYHEDTALFPALVNLSYTVFDFGARTAKIDQAKANLLAADFSFNDTHRRIIFRVTEAYYRLLDAMGQEDAARATLNDAQTVQQAIEARLANGLATLPDVLEARATTAQAQYELASIQGLEAIARGALATVLGASPTGMFRIEDVSKAPMSRIDRRADGDRCRAGDRPAARPAGTNGADPVRRSRRSRRPVPPSILRSAFPGTWAIRIRSGNRRTLALLHNRRSIRTRRKSRSLGMSSMAGRAAMLLPLPDPHRKKPERR